MEIVVSTLLCFESSKLLRELKLEIMPELK
jgi:hypothetical protein